MLFFNRMWVMMTTNLAFCPLKFRPVAASASLPQRHGTRRQFSSKSGKTDQDGKSDGNVHGSLYQHITSNADNKKCLTGWNYVDNDAISFVHESFPGRLKVSTDYKLCKDGNRMDNNGDTVYCYIDADCKRHFDANWNGDRIADNIKQLSDWEGMAYVPKSHKPFIVNQIARPLHAFPKISATQRDVSRKYLVPLHLQDDVLEELYVSNKWWNLGIKYGQNICDLYSGHCSGHKGMEADIAMYQKEYDIPDKICAAMNNAFKLHMIVEKLLREQLHPAIYGACCGVLRKYVDCMNIEQSLIQSVQGQKKFIEPERNQYTRTHTFGIPMWTASVLYEPLMTKYVDTNDSLLNTMSWVAAIENDLFGSPKDMVGNTFDPTSVTNYMLCEKFNGNQVETFKYLLNQSNGLKYMSKKIIDSMDPIRKNYFDHIFTLINVNFDFHFCTGVHDPNVRYGWKPVLKQ